MAIAPDQKHRSGKAGSPLSIGLSFVLPPASTRVLPLAITNQGETAVDWKADVGGASWLSLDRDFGHIMAHEVQTLYVTANTRTLKLGDTLLATVTLKSQGLEPAQIGVELVVSLTANNDGGPHIAIVNDLNTQAQLQNQPQGKNTTSWQFTNPESNGQVKWTMNAGGVDWVNEITPSDGILQGGEQVTVQVTTDTTRAPGAGNYRTDLVLTLTFEPNNENREPSSVLIPLSVTVP